MYDSKTVIAHCTSHVLDLGVAMMNTSSKDSGGWKYGKPGEKNWSVTGDSLYTFDAAYGFSQLMGLVTNRTKVMVKLATTEATNKSYYGYGYITKLTLNLPNQDTATYSFAFEGDGALTEVAGT